MENVFIVIISVEYTKSRKVCEQIQNMVFDSKHDVHKYLLEKHEIGNAGVISLSDYMDNVNDQYLDNLTDSFISYVRVGK